MGDVVSGRAVRVSNVAPQLADTPAPRRRMGEIEKAVRAYVRSLSKLDGPAPSFKAMAIRLAKFYDAFEGADPVKLARLNMELRQTLSAIAEATKHDEGTKPALATPEWTEVPASVRDGAQPGTPDARRPAS